MVAAGIARIGPAHRGHVDQPRAAAALWRKGGLPASRAPALFAHWAGSNGGSKARLDSIKSSGKSLGGRIKVPLAKFDLRLI